MELFVFGTSQNVASAAVRARLHVDLDDLYRGLQPFMVRRRLLAEAIPLSTCGRLELYGVTPDTERARALLTALVAQHGKGSLEDVERYAYLYTGSAAVRHLFRVAAGLDSVIHGEAQVLGQVRQAAHHVGAATTEGPVLHRLFRQALRTGKRVRTETGIGRGATSLAGAAVAMLQREMGGLDTASVLVIGAGETGALMARLLAKAGVGRLVVANRTLERAEEVTGSLGAEACALALVPALLSDVDVVIGAISAPTPFITGHLLEEHRNGRRPRYLLDLAHPPSLEPGLAERPGITVFDLEHVFGRVESDMRARTSQVPMAESIVDEEAHRFLGWLRSRDNAPVVRALRRHVLDRAMNEAERYAAKVPEEHRNVVRQLARSVALALVHRPTVALRDADPDSDEGRALLTHVPGLFGVSEAALDRTGDS